MRIKRVFALLSALALLCGTALADWTAPDANLARYTETYAEAVEAYKTLQYGASGAQVGALKEALSTLGYFPYRVSDNFYRTLETAIRLFAQQMRIGGDGREITPLMQAMLADAANMPKAICPVLDLTPYSWEEDGSNFIPYTYARITRSSVINGAQVGFHGVITSTMKTGGTYYYTVMLEEAADKLVYVVYQPLPRTTVFQTGDAVAVFGTTQGEQSFPYNSNMEKLAPLVKADRIGYSK